MSVDRKDVRAKLDEQLHAALVAICDLDGVTQAEFIETLLVPAIRKRLHDAIQLGRTAERLGITGNNRESGGEGA